MAKIMTFRHPRLTSCCVLLMAAAGLHGQEVEPKHLATIEEVLKYDISKAEAKPRAVRVKSVVVGVSSLFNYFHMHEGHRGIAVRYPRRLAPPKQGDQIEVTGETTVNIHNGLRIMRILAEDFTITGTAELPKAEPMQQ